MILNIDSFISSVLPPLSLTTTALATKLTQPLLKHRTAIYFQVLQCWREAADLCSSWKYEHGKCALQLLRLAACPTV